MATPDNPEWSSPSHSGYFYQPKAQVQLDPTLVVAAYWYFYDHSHVPVLIRFTDGRYAIDTEISTGGVTLEFITASTDDEAKAVAVVTWRMQ